MRTPLLLIIIICFPIIIIAQADSIQTMNLMDELTFEQKENTELLPAKFLFTQKILWGQNGLMRNFKYFELTPEKRQRELKLRREMLTAHQMLGFLTLGSMIAQGVIGVKLYNGDLRIKDTHEAIASLVNASYFTTAGLALFAPPKMLDERKGYSSIKIHKILSIIHLSSMIATNILAGELEQNPKLRPYHRAAAFTALGSFAAAMIIIKF